MPGVGAHIPQGSLGSPVKELAALLGVRVAGGDVAGAAGTDPMGQGEAVDLFESFHHIEDGVALARAQVEDLRAGVGHQVVDGGGVPLRQIHHVDVVPHAGAVGGGIIVAEDDQLLANAAGGLGDEGHQVVGDAVGRFADAARGVGPHGVEVPKEHRGPGGVGLHIVPDDLLAHELGPAIGVGAAHAAGLVEGHGVLRAVNRGGGGEDDPLHTVFAHDLQKRHGGQQVVLIVRQGLLHALPHGLEAREVDGAADVVLPEHLVQGRLVPHVDVVEGHLLPGELLHPSQGLGGAVAEVVHGHHIIAQLQQSQTRMGPDVPGAAGDQYLHIFLLILRRRGNRGSASI